MNNASLIEVKPRRSSSLSECMPPPCSFYLFRSAPSFFCSFILPLERIETFKDIADIQHHVAARENEGALVFFWISKTRETEWKQKRIKEEREEVCKNSREKKDREGESYISDFKKREQQQGKRGKESETMGERSFDIWRVFLSGNWVCYIEVFFITLWVFGVSVWVWAESVEWNDLGKERVK